MNLLLIRHATAAPHGLPGGDFNRSLIEKGQQQSRRVGNFLREHDLLPEILLSSPVLRAKETAELLTEEGAPEPTIAHWLSYGMRPEEALSELRAYQEFKRVAIVGHEPDFSSLAEFLLGTSAYSIRVKKASIISIEMAPSRQGGMLNFSIPCKFLR